EKESKMYKLTNKTICVGLIICVAWLIIAQVRHGSVRRTLNRNHKQINVIHEQIEKDKTSLTADPNAPVSKDDLLKLTKINAMELQIAGLRAENTAELRRNNKQYFPDLFVVILLVFVADGVETIKKKLAPGDTQASH
ncbi:MAG: hypothetical protein JSU94_05620, partial [Phycisphaerales bacterium]